MQRLINALQSEWEGLAAQSYDEQFQQLKPAFQDMRNLIEDIATQLDQSAAAMEQLDVEMASKYGV